jgi:membrane associated rhomboid family serine protease
MPLTAYYILKVIDWGAVPVGVFAFIHALLQRPDAYTAADRLTKPAWLAITGGSAFAVFIFSFASVAWMFWMAGLVAALVYIVDVRPKLIEVQRGNKW